MGAFAGTAQFEVRRRVGEGATGIVYEAYDRERDAIVALKQLRLRDARSLYDFKREFRALVDLHHPNLITLHALSTDDNDWLLSMEFVDGVDFTTWVHAGRDPAAVALATGPAAYAETMVGASERQAAEAVPAEEVMARLRSPVTRPPLSRGELRRLRSALRQLCDGVAALHAAGKLHRDIKPSNALVTHEGRVVLVDFGLVADLDASPGAEVMIVGTPAYMAPEQCGGHPATPAQDWYAVGVILYEVLVGRLPFAGRPMEIMVDKQRCDPPAPAELVDGVPEDLNLLCVDLLRRDPGQRPSGSEIIRRVGGTLPDRWAADSFVSARRSAGPRVIGRAAELGALDDAFAAVAAGRATSLFVHGPSGMGKTALVESFLDGIERSDTARVFRGRCYERESVPYKGVDSVVDALATSLTRMHGAEVAELVPPGAAALVRLFPTLRRVEAFAAAVAEPIASDPLAMRRAGFAAFRELLVRLSRQRPVVLYIDDMHWSDADSAALLTDVLGGPHAAPVLLIASFYTAEPGAPWLPDIAARWLAVGALDLAHARDMALAMLGDDSEARELATAIASESGGNPLFLGELVRHAMEATDTRVEGLQLETVLQSRIARLAAPARALLEATAVSGRPPARGVLRRAAQLGAEDELAIAALRGGRLIRTTGGRDTDEIDVSHHRIRSAIAAALEPQRVIALHRSLAVALGAIEADPEILAYHFQHAAEPRRALDHVLAAARRAADSLAFERAAQLYRRALELRTHAGIEHDGGEGELRVRLAESLAWAGRGGEAAAEYLRAQQLAEPANVPELRRRRAEELLRSGHFDEAIEALGDVLASVGMKLPRSPWRALPSLLAGRARVRMHGLSFRAREEHAVPPADLMRIDTCWAVSNGLGLVDTIRGADFQAKHLLLALKAGEPRRVARALAAEASYTAASGSEGRSEARAIVARARDVLQQASDPLTLALVELSQGLTEFLDGRWAESIEIFQRAEHAFLHHGRGVQWEINAVRGFVIWALSYRGELREVARKVDAAARDARERGDRYTLAALCGGMPNLGWLVGGDAVLARKQVVDAMSLWSRAGFHVQHYYEQLALAHIDLYEGNREAAWQRITSRWSALTRSLLMRVQQVRVEMRFCRARTAIAAAGADSQRLAVAAADADELEREDLTRAAGLAALLRAGIAEARDDRDRAVVCYREAIAALEASETLLHAACGRRRLAELLGGSEGEAMRKAVDASLAAQGVAEPARIAEVFAPAQAR